MAVRRAGGSSHHDGPPESRSREVVIGEAVTWLSRWALRWIVIAVGAALLGWVLQQLWSIVLPVLLALILTTVLQPPARWLETRLRFPQLAAAASAVAGSLLALAGVIVFIAPSVAAQVGEIADSASEGLTRLQAWVEGSDTLDVTHAQVESAVDAFQERLRSSASSIASGVLVGVGTITSALVNVLVTLVLAFFFLKDGRSFLPWLRRTTGPHVGTHLTEVGSRAWDTLGGFVRTQALVGLIDAALIGAALLLLGVPLAVPLAVLTFIAAFAPIVGAVTVGALAVLVALVTNGWVVGLAVLVVVLVVQQLEGNVLLPWLQGKSLDLHAAVVLLAIVLGSTLFGVAGAFLSVPVVAVGAVVARYLDERIDHATADDRVEDDDAHAGEDAPDA
ncbi:AI-2E family transporter [Mycobacterium cookii]|uniref:AI-2E family transporter n=1 Tax=Nocardioides furvisabuli TaxID=375542 RepID=A0ABP5JCR8_9ACTN|nr:AI-2E family transporter [Nocardioides furvisabuli]